MTRTAFRQAIMVLVAFGALCSLACGTDSSPGQHDPVATPSVDKASQLLELTDLPGADWTVEPHFAPGACIPVNADEIDRIGFQRRGGLALEEVLYSFVDEPSAMTFVQSFATGIDFSTLVCSASPTADLLAAPTILPAPVVPAGTASTLLYRFEITVGRVGLTAFILPLRRGTQVNLISLSGEEADAYVRTPEFDIIIRTASRRLAISN
jgi:hypothetical protein